MLNTFTPETTPFTLAAIVPASDLVRYLASIHYINVDKFLGFPQDWLWIETLSGHRCDRQSDKVYLRVTISESWWPLEAEMTIGGQHIYGRVSFNELFENFAVVPAGSETF